jgi:hypoxanthine phosphoribosyltransferase
MTPAGEANRLDLEQHGRDCRHLKPVISAEQIQKRVREMGGLRSRGAASVRLTTLLDCQTARRLALQLDYFGFLVDDKFLVGYGLG